MSNASSPNTTPIEYTRGGGFGFPSQPSFAQDTSSATSATSATVVATVQATAPTGPSTGQLWYNTTAGHLYCWTGAAWQQA